MGSAPAPNDMWATRGTCSIGIPTAPAFRWKKGKSSSRRRFWAGWTTTACCWKGRPRTIAAETRRLIETVGREGFMVGADCTVPNTIEIERLRAAVDAAKA